MPLFKKQVDQSNGPSYWFLCLLSKAAENKFPLPVGVWKQGINTRKQAHQHQNSYWKGHKAWWASKTRGCQKIWKKKTIKILNLHYLVGCSCSWVLSCTVRFTKIKKKSFFNLSSIYKYLLHLNFSVEKLKINCQWGKIQYIFSEISLISWNAVFSMFR